MIKNSIVYKVASYIRGLTADKYTPKGIHWRTDILTIIKQNNVHILWGVLQNRKRLRPQWPCICNHLRIEIKINFPVVQKVHADRHPAGHLCDSMTCGLFHKKVYELQIQTLTINSLVLTCWTISKIIKDVFIFCIVSWFLVQQKKTKFTMEQPYMLPTLYCQYHAYWCPGDLRSQGISRHGNDPQSRNIRSPALEELRYMFHLYEKKVTMIRSGHNYAHPTTAQLSWHTCKIETWLDNWNPNQDNTRFQL